MRRGRLTVLVTTPKLALVKVPFGGPNWGWLNRLKNSVRNSTLNLSVMEVLLNTAKSKLTTPCCLIVASTRGSLPKTHSLLGPPVAASVPPGWVKQEVLNHSETRETELPEVDLWQPET